MGSGIYFWIIAAIALAIGLLMLIDFRKYHQKVFNVLFILFLIIFIKSIIYLLINLPEPPHLIPNPLHLTDANTPENIIDPAIRPLYDFRYFIFQAIETIFIIALSYHFVIARKEVDESNVKGTKMVMWIQYALVVLTSGVVIFASLTMGDKTTFQTQIPVIELIKNYGKFLFVIWKILLLAMAFSSVRSVFGYITNLLRVISRYKKRIITLILIEMFFNVFSAVIPMYAQPLWFVFQIISLLFLTVYAFGNHTSYINSIQENVNLLNKEKDLIVSLMKEISAIIGSGDFDLETVIRKIVDDSVKGTAARGGAALLKDPITNRLLVKHVEGLYPPSQPFKSTSGITLTEAAIVNKLKAEKIAIGEGLLGKVAETGESIFIPDAMKDERYIQTVQEHMTVASFIAVPLKSKEDVFGVLTIVDDAKMFLESDLSLLETLGEQAAITIKQMQMYQEVLEKKQAEKEIGVAGEIQSSLIPHTFPEVEKFELYGFSIPAKGVGGDYYDYIDFGNNKIALAMFDVSGKGVPASLIMVMIRSILRTIASLNEDTKDVLIKLNNTIAEEIVEDRYATGFYLLFDAEKGIMSYTNAGHGPLILFRAASEEFEFLDTDGMPVGIMSGVEYGQNYTILEKGDIAILYTDGITEAMNSAHEEFGMEKLKEVIKGNKRESAREIANKILEAITRFAAGAPQHDDETLLVLKNK